MPALDPSTRERWRRLVVVDPADRTIGTVTSFYLDRESGLPRWALVLTGWFSDQRAFVPLADAREEDGEIVVPCTLEQVRTAPGASGPDGELTPADERALVGHYGL